MIAPDQVHGSQLLKAYRARFGVKQHEIALLLGKTQPDISAFEQRRRQPDINSAVILELVTGGTVPVQAWADVSFVSSSWSRFAGSQSSVKDLLPGVEDVNGHALSQAPGKINAKKDRVA